MFTRPQVSPATYAAPDGPPVSPQVAGPAERACPNCGTPAPLAYCPACGQEQHDLHRSVRGIAEELLDTFAGWDAKVVATLRLLLLRPGALTAEFLAGRRVRYLRPLRLYLSAVAVFFVALELPAPGARAAAARRAAAADQRLADSLHLRGGLHLEINHVRLDTLAAPGKDASLGHRLGYAVGRRLRALDTDANREVRVSAVDQAFTRRMGNTVLLFVPVSAGLLALLWRRRRLYYPEHLVFALHAHTQGLVAVGVAHFLPGDWKFVPTAWSAVYFWLALRRVYGAGRESRRRTTVKYVAFGGAYFVVFLAGLLGTFVVAIFEAAG